MHGSSKTSCYYTFEGEDFKTSDASDCEFLSGEKFAWIRTKNSKIPSNAVRLCDFQYIGRLYINNTVLIGTIYQENDFIYASYSGEEHYISMDYDILSRK